MDGRESGRIFNDGEVWLAVHEFFVCHGEMQEVQQFLS